MYGIYKYVEIWQFWSKYNSLRFNLKRKTFDQLFDESTNLLPITYKIWRILNIVHTVLINYIY